LSRNIYQDVIPSLKSLLKNGNIDWEWTWMLPDDQVRIRHRMASKGTWKTEPEVEMYRRMTWEEVFRK
jgi:hypothetical protein